MFEPTMVFRDLARVRLVDNVGELSRWILISENSFRLKLWKVVDFPNFTTGDVNARFPIGCKDLPL